MRYSKTQVNEIIDKLRDRAQASFDRYWSDVDFEYQIDLIKEEYGLIDKRTRDFDFQLSEIIEDFVSMRLTYKEIAKKYHTSEKNIRRMLNESADDDERIYYEMEYRSK